MIYAPVGFRFSSVKTIESENENGKGGKRLQIDVDHGN